MPFRSKAQQRAAFAGVLPGFSRKKAKEWAYATPDLKGLPEHVEKAAELTPGARARIKETNFVFPEQKKYPIHDRRHALAALGFVGMHGTPSEKAAVHASVAKKYPGLEIEKKASVKLQGETEFQGLDIAIENLKGSTRTWHDPHGKETGSTKMHFSYGYIRGSEGTDGDHVDCYLGPNPDAPMVYIVDQMKNPDFKTFDEQKVMLGFADAKAAKAAYLRQYNDPRFFGSMREMPLDEFREKVLNNRNHGEKISGHVEDRFFKGDSRGRRTHLPGNHLKAMKARIAAANAGDISKLPKAFTLPFRDGSTAIVEKVPTKSGDRLVLKTIYSASMTSRDVPVSLQHLEEAMTQRKAASFDASYFAELNLARLSSGEDMVADTGIKVADRLERLADHVDDAGIGILAAPYAASAIGEGLERFKNPKAKALGKVISAGMGVKSRFGESHARELAGLALVAPGVTNRVAGVVDRTVPKEKGASLESVASSLYPDYEYMTQEEQQRINGMLLGLGKTAAALVNGVMMAGNRAFRRSAAKAETAAAEKLVARGGGRTKAVAGAPKPPKVHLPTPPTISATSAGSKAPSAAKSVTTAGKPVVDPEVAAKVKARIAAARVESQSVEKFMRSSKPSGKGVTQKSAPAPKPASAATGTSSGHDPAEMTRSIRTSPAAHYGNPSTAGAATYVAPATAPTVPTHATPPSVAAKQFRNQQPGNDFRGYSAKSIPAVPPPSHTPIGPAEAPIHRNPQEVAAALGHPDTFTNNGINYTRKGAVPAPLASGPHPGSVTAQAARAPVSVTTPPVTSAAEAQRLPAMPAGALTPGGAVAPLRSMPGAGAPTVIPKPMKPAGTHPLVSAARLATGAGIGMAGLGMGALAAGGGVAMNAVQRAQGNQGPEPTSFYGQGRPA